ncbi:MAG: hypothetical protein ABUT20_64465 [Bacteroidota bacterium]
MTAQLIILFLLSVLFLFSCKAPKGFAKSYYKKNETILTGIEETYRTLYKQKPFSIEFSDRSFKYISIEFITDSLKYIYEFSLDETDLKDSLTKFGYDAKAIVSLISNMKSIECTWINNLDYFTNGKRKSLIFISIRPRRLDIPYNTKKYYILTFYPQPQYYDKEGRLLEGRRLRKLRRLNEETFWRINDKVCYTLSDRFR